MEDAQTDCRAVLKKLYLYLDGEIAGVDCAQLEAHLRECEPCVKRAGFEREFKEALAKRCREERVPPELLDRIRAALDL